LVLALNSYFCLYQDSMCRTWILGPCSGEGEDTTLRSRPSSPCCTNGGKMTGTAHPSSSSLQDEGLQRSLSVLRPHLTWRPTWDSAHSNRPHTEKRVTGLICNSLTVMTVCNPSLWEYSGDSPGARGHKRPYIGTLDTRAPINTPVQYPWEAGLTEQLPSRVKPCLRSFHSPVGSTCPGEQVPTFSAHRSCYEQTTRDGTQES
jgi:hypothetical protein